MSEAFDGLRFAAIDVEGNGHQPAVQGNGGVATPAPVESA